MNYRNQKKSTTAITIIRRITVGLLFLALFFLLEPAFKDRLAFAVTYFDHPDIIYANHPAGSGIPTTAPRKTQAPEPSTLILFLGGIASIIARFAQKSFEKFKRYSDILLSILGLTITSPILLFAAILIKLNSKGRVIYKQNRVGMNGEIFEIYKLRTMRLDAEKNTGAVWAKENDPRITSVGRVLRKAHIDEIPQLINVVKGEMSIIGPRPERPELVRDLKELIRDYEKRLQVKPGITGLAQVWHKYDETIEDVKKKIKYDLLYTKRMCLAVDLKILGQTFVAVLTGKGAN